MYCMHTCRFFVKEYIWEKREKVSLLLLNLKYNIVIFPKK